eukprot:scaffold154746_cov39-Attheya_sp.AAC.1
MDLEVVENFRTHLNISKNPKKISVLAEVSVVQGGTGRMETEQEMEVETEGASNEAYNELYFDMETIDAWRPSSESNRSDSVSSERSFSDSSDMSSEQGNNRYTSIRDHSNTHDHMITRQQKIDPTLQLD